MDDSGDFVSSTKKSFLKNFKVSNNYFLFGLFLIFFLLFLISIGPLEGFKNFGLLGQRKGEQKALAAGSVSLTSTFKSISFYTSYPDTSPSVKVEYRQAGSSNWLAAYDPYIDSGDKQVRGSIVGLSPNTNYEVKVTFGGTDSAVASISTKNDQLSFGSGKTYYVGTDGSDSNEGTSSAAPFKTIQKAAGTVAAGDTVKIKAGIYKEQVNIAKSGTDGNLISFTANGDGEVVIAGGDSCASSNSQNNFQISSQNYIRISGLTMKNASEAAIRIDGGGNHIIDNNKILDFNCADLSDQLRAGVAAWNGSKNLWVLQNTISRTAKNTLLGDGFWTKNTSESAGGGHIIAKNTINGVYDAVGGEPEDTTYGGIHKDSDVYENNVSECNDDGIQPEGGNYNVRVWGNTIKSCMLGVGMAPTKKGPLYVFRNVIVDSKPRWTGGQGMYKLGDSTTGRIYVFHNSYYSTNTADGFKQSNSGLGNMFVRNNSVYASRYAIETSSHNGLPMDFNNDVLYTTDSSRFVKWNNNNDYTDLAKFQVTGQEKQGIQGDPKYTNGSGGDLSLQSGAPGIDRGVVLANFNDANSAWKFSGNAPDVGAIEKAGAVGSPAPSPIPSPSPSPSPKPSSPTPSPTPSPSPTPVGGATSPLPSPTPSPSPSPSPIPTPTSTPTPTPSPTPSPAPTCQILSASWSKSSANEGEQIRLYVSGSSACNGKTVNLTVRENDSAVEGLGDDNVSTNPASVVFVETNARGIWTAEWQNDCSGLCNPPEYYFIASLVDNPSISLRSASPLLEVQKVLTGSAVPSPSPTAALFTDDFETGNDHLWTSKTQETGNTVEVVPPSSLQGTYGLHIKTSTANDDARLKKGITGTSQVFTRVMMKLNSDIGDASFPQTVLYAAANADEENSGAALGVARRDSQNKLFTWNSQNNSWRDSGFSLEPAKWYCVESQIVIGTTNGAIRAWVDGRAVSDQGGINTGSVPVSWLRLGADGPKVSADYNFDNFAVDTSARLGCTGISTSAQDLVFKATDDTFVDRGRPNRNYGANSSLKVDGSPKRDILAKFNVREIGARRITGAKLRVYVTDPSDKSGGALARLTSANWGERSVTWNNAPVAESTQIGSLGRVAAGNWYEFDIANAITGDGEVGFRITSTAGDGANYASKEYNLGNFTSELFVSVE